MKAENNYEADIAIVGGGVAGCTAAMALAQSYSVVLIDKLAQPIERIGECLAPASRRILKKLNLLEGLERNTFDAGKKAHLTNNGTQSYWGSDQLHVVDPMRNPDGFGWHLDRRAFELYLREAALQRGVVCHWDSKLQNSYYENYHWHITARSTGEISDQKTYTIKAKFVIDASGRQSNFARQQGIERTHFDKLIACWATLPNNEQNKMSTILATESGWWYSAPLPNNKRVIALQTDSDLINREVIKNASQFIELAKVSREMAKILEKNPGEIEFHGIVAANSTRLNQVAGRQWAALGDAAMSFDPLSSQGMFNAMAGALQLSELIVESGVIPEPDSIKMEQLQLNYMYQMDQVWDYYLKHKSIFYREERRWKDSVFWKRRH
jgi:flavin-dependent dehydrogenase